MTRIRTHNNRRRSRELKQGGLYRWAYSARGLPSWGDTAATPEQILADIRSVIDELKGHPAPPHTPIMISEYHRERILRGIREDQP